MDSANQNYLPVTSYMRLRKHGLSKAKLYSYHNIYDTNLKYTDVCCKLKGQNAVVISNVDDKEGNHGLYLPLDTEYEHLINCVITDPRLDVC
jgi:hypothetical protein